MTKKITFGIPGLDSENVEQHEVLADALLDKLDFCFQVEYGGTSVVYDSDAGYPELLHIHLYSADEDYDQSQVNKAYAQIAQEFNFDKANVKLEVTDLESTSLG